MLLKFSLTFLLTLLLTLLISCAPAAGQYAKVFYCQSQQSGASVIVTSPFQPVDAYNMQVNDIPWGQNWVTACTNCGNYLVGQNVTGAPFQCTEDWPFPTGVWLQAHQSDNNINNIVNESKVVHNLRTTHKYWVTIVVYATVSICSSVVFWVNYLFWVKYF